jgi:hypothetical protein
VVLEVVPCNQQKTADKQGGEPPVLVDHRQTSESKIVLTFIPVWLIHYWPVADMRLALPNVRL